MQIVGEKNKGEAGPAAFNFSVGLLCRGGLDSRTKEEEVDQVGETFP
jgi:hypothetical protein